MKIFENKDRNNSEKWEIINTNESKSNSKRKGKKK